MLLIVGEFQMAGVGKDDAGVFKAARHVVDHHVVERAALAVLALHEEVISRNLGIEDPLGNFQFGRFLAHGIKQGPHLCLRDRQHIVLKEKRSDGYKGNQHDQRAHYFQKGNSGGFHGRKLEPLPQVSENHQ